MKYLKELTLKQLLDIQGEHFADNIQAEKHADTYSNHVNRHVVRALAQEKGAAFLGVFYPRFAGMPLFRPWEGECIPAFSADFVTPTLDEELIRMVEDYAVHRNEHARLFDIHARIEEVGGCLLCWFAEEPEESRLRVLD